MDNDSSTAAYVDVAYNAFKNSPKSVTLDTPIQRGEQTIASVLVRKPKSGELKGTSLAELAQLDVGALIRVLPRITVPPLLPHEVEALEPSDLMKLGGEVIAFLLPASDRASLTA